MPARATLPPFLRGFRVAPPAIPHKAADGAIAVLPKCFCPYETRNVAAGGGWPVLRMATSSGFKLGQMERRLVQVE